MLFAGLPKRKRPVIVWSDLEIDEVIGTSLTNPRKPHFTRCQMVAYMGEYSMVLPANYQWDGASIPRLCWSLLGITPDTPSSLIASAFHDKGCESPHIPQVVADATFVSLLRPIRFNGRRLKGVGMVRATLMYMAVRAYSIFVRPVARWFK